MKAHAIQGKSGEKKNPEHKNINPLASVEKDFIYLLFFVLRRNKLNKRVFLEFF